MAISSYGGQATGGKRPGAASGSGGLQYSQNAFTDAQRRNMGAGADSFDPIGAIGSGLSAAWNWASGKDAADAKANAYGAYGDAMGQHAKDQWGEAMGGLNQAEGYYAPAQAQYGRDQQTLAGPGLLQQRYQQSLQGNDPYYEYMQRLGTANIQNQMSSMGLGSSSAALGKVGNYQADLGAQRSHEMDALAGAASGEAAQREGQLWNEGMGLGGAQAGLVGGFYGMGMNAQDRAFYAQQDAYLAKAGVSAEQRQQILGSLGKLGGAAVGFGLGGPAGAAVGYQLGGTLGGGGGNTLSIPGVGGSGGSAGSGGGSAYNQAFGPGNLNGTMNPEW